VNVSTTGGTVDIDGSDGIKLDSSSGGMTMNVSNNLVASFGGTVAITCDTEMSVNQPLLIGSSNSWKGALRIPTGAATTSTNTSHVEFWFDGTDLKARFDGTDVTLASFS
jgi:hypothetical protein